MLASAMWRRVGLVRTDVLEKLVASVFEVERTSERETTVAVPTKRTEG
jgi:hypothetical protein